MVKSALKVSDVFVKKGSERFESETYKTLTNSKKSKNNERCIIALMKHDAYKFECKQFFIFNREFGCSKQVEFCVILGKDNFWWLI